MKRRRHIPDNRLDWRDPAMPVIGKSGREIDHTKMTTKAKMAMAVTSEPLWRNDPTYNLRRRKNAPN
jgi:hypothetical protein